MGEKPEIANRKIFGLTFNKVKHHKRGDYSAKSLREDFGATHADKAKEAMSQIIPAVLAFVLYSALTKVLKSESDKK